MAVLKILRYPDKRLRVKSTPVSEFNSTLHELLDSMYETMGSESGVGLAAIQVDVPKRALIINIPREEDDMVHPEDLLEIINPEFISTTGSLIFNEGCLSLPGFYNDVARFNEIELRYFDRYGNEQYLHATGYKAVAIQHEFDHLEGTLFVDRLSLMQRKKFEKEFKQLQKEKKARAKNA